MKRRRRRRVVSLECNWARRRTALAFGSARLGSRRRWGPAREREREWESCREREQLSAVSQCVCAFCRHARTTPAGTRAANTCAHAGRTRPAAGQTIPITRHTGCACLIASIYCKAEPRRQKPRIWPPLGERRPPKQTHTLSTCCKLVRALEQVCSCVCARLSSSLCSFAWAALQKKRERKKKLFISVLVHRNLLLLKATAFEHSSELAAELQLAEPRRGQRRSEKESRARGAHSSSILGRTLAVRPKICCPFVAVRATRARI